MYNYVPCGDIGPKNMLGGQLQTNPASRLNRYLCIKTPKIEREIAKNTHKNERKGL